MRLMGCIACGSMAIDCAMRAQGITPQTMLGPDYIWLWWVFAFCWCTSAIRFLIGRLDG